jgi:UDP-glucose 4-epimerase
MRIVVTGGAGYIGSHVVQALKSKGIEPIVVDNLSSGRDEFIPDGIRFEKIDITDLKNLRDFFSNSDLISGVIHLAGQKYAGESVSRPLDFYETNTYGVTCVLKAMTEANIQNFVFSSSCSVYGDTNLGIPVNENAPLKPQSPYGKSKLFAEEIISDHMHATGMKATCLRYFNVAGNGAIRAHDRSPYNLFPNIYRAIEDGTKLSVFLSELKTKDGTCIRDYVDVNLLADSHIIALEKLMGGVRLDFAYNLGSEIGTSTLEIVQAARNLFGIEFDLLPARTGDPSVITADTHRAQTDLDWSHSVSIEKMLTSGFKAWKNFEAK